MVLSERSGFIISQALIGVVFLRRLCMTDDLFLSVRVCACVYPSQEDMRRGCSPTCLPTLIYDMPPDCMCKHVFFVFFAQASSPVNRFSVGYNFFLAKLMFVKKKKKDRCVIDSHSYCT